MSGWPEVERGLDFIVIGVQKGGTTSLWEYLRRHPRIAMPAYKEAPVFCAGEGRLPAALAEFMRSSFGEAPGDTMLGKVATHYMMGWKGVDVEGISERIARTLPEVRLVALLRDPVERAISHYRMSVRRGFEDRSLDAAVNELLEPDSLTIGRARADETNSYLVQGEYGRILTSYRRRFPPERVHVEMTADLARDAGAAIDRVLGFLGLPPGHRPDGLDVRHHRGGTRRRLDAEGEARLNAFMAENVWPSLGDEAERVKMSFDFFMQTWNVIPDDVRPALSAANRERLESHYRSDARLLEELGIAAPWLVAWGA